LCAPLRRSLLIGFERCTQLIALVAKGLDVVSRCAEFDEFLTQPCDANLKTSLVLGFIILARQFAKLKLREALAGCTGQAGQQPELDQGQW
jgi:hypothetical protein